MFLIAMNEVLAGPHEDLERCETREKCSLGVIGAVCVGKVDTVELCKGK